MEILLDFETRSRCDIKCGADRYAVDPSTDILCCSFLDVDTGWSADWVPHYDGFLPRDISKKLQQAELLMAFGARFDQSIWEFIAVDRYMFPLIEPQKWYCVAAQARVNALPGALGNCAKALGLPQKKDHRGKYLISKLSKPQGPKSQYPDEFIPLDSLEGVALLDEMAYKYCPQDNRTALGILQGCRRLNATEFADWHINERINDRGIGVDIELATDAQAYAKAEIDEISRECRDITCSTVEKPTQRQRIANWIENRISGNALKLFTVYTDGLAKFSLAKDIRQTVFAMADEGALTRADFPDECYNLLACYDDANKSSVAKFKRMTDMQIDGKVYGAFVYAGAATLRYTSRGLQLHNFKRDCLKVAEVEQLKRDMAGGVELTNVMTTLGRALRPALIPDPGYVFVVGDWAGVENRMAPWLSAGIMAAESSAKAKLETFTQCDKDPSLPDNYVKAAANLGSDDRQLGKIVELSLQFLGADGALMSMAKTMGISLADRNIPQLVARWRAANRWAIELGNGLFSAAVRAVRCGDSRRYNVGRCGYSFDAAAGTLHLHLPSGTMLSYPQARVATADMDLSALKANWTPKGDDPWPRYSLWRGVCIENATQAECATLLRQAVKECAMQNLSVVLHCHDEIVLHVRKSEASEAVRKLQNIMEFPKTWAAGLPLKAIPMIVTRYGK